jgi:uncharacterized protein YhfF
MYLPEGPARPDKTSLDAFWARARAANAAAGWPADYQVRWIGLDAPSTREILDLIRSRDKTGTFTLPWIVERTDQPAPQAGDCIILIDFDGAPALIVRLVRIHRVRFGTITAADTAVDGSPVRDLGVWKPLHTRYWNALLMPYGLGVTDDMPVWVEQFEVAWEGG